MIIREIVVGESFALVMAMNMILLHSQFLEIKDSLKRSTRNFVVFFICSIYSYAIEIITSQINPGLIRGVLLLVCAIVIVSVTSFFYSGAWYKRIFTFIMLQFFFIMSELIVWWIILIGRSPVEALKFVEGRWGAGYITVVFTLIGLLLMRRISKYKQKHTSREAVMIYILMFLTMMMASIPTLFTPIPLLSVTLFFLLLFFYGSFKLTEKIYRDNHELELKQQKQQLLKEYYCNIEKHHQEVRIVKHDMKNHLQSLNGYLLQKDYSHMICHIDKLISKIDEENSLIDMETEEIIENKELNSEIDY